MGIYKDKIIVADFEATCWPGFDAPEGQTNEIIEIGLCLLNPETGEISDKNSILVKPTESIVSDFCTELTSITQAMVDTDGQLFDDACNRLETEFNARNRMWASWGSWDRLFLMKQCKRRGVRYPFSKKHVNMKRLFGDQTGRRLPFKHAMASAKLDMIGTHHRGHDDAHNSARLLYWLVQQHGIGILRRYGW